MAGKNFRGDIWKAGSDTAPQFKISNLNRLNFFTFLRI